MNTIERYIFKRAFLACIGSTIAIVALVWTSQSATRIDFATGSGGSITAFLHFMGLLVPLFLASVLPFGLVIGTTQILNTMNMDSEMPVVASAGISRWRLAKPFLLIGLLSGAYLFISNHFIEPYSNMASRDVLTQSRTELLTSLIQPNRFVDIDDDLTIYVEGKTGQTLAGIMISDRREADLDLIYYAQSGAVGIVDDQQILVMNDGEIHRKTRNEPNVAVIKFRSYALSLAQFSPENSSTRYFLRERQTSYLLNPDPNDKMVQSRPGEVRAQLHKRMTNWLYAILMVLVALVLAGKPRSHRSAAITNHILGFGTALVYFALSSAFYDLNKIEANHIYLIYALPIGGIAASAFMYHFGIGISLPQWALVALDRVVGTAQKLLQSRKKRVVQA